MLFESKKDAWISVVIWLAIGAIVVSVCSVWIDVIASKSLAEAWAALGFSFAMTGVILFMGWIWFGTNYTLAEEELLIRSGPFTWHMPYCQIVEVRESGSLLSAPALSTDRLAIKRREAGTGVLISPEDKQGFLDALGRIIPGVTMPDIR